MAVSPRRLDDIENRLPRTARGDVELFPQPLHIIDFATNHRYLGKALFPAQATVLKVAALAPELFTDFDRDLLARWMQGFELTGDADAAAWVGGEGTPGDLMQRMSWCREHGRRWFSEIIFLLGRRGSKNYLAGIFMAWVIWNLLTTEDPHERYGIDPGKRLTGMVFAGKKDQAWSNQLRDLAWMIHGAPCFQVLHPHVTADSVLMFTPAQIAARVDTRDHTKALFEIKAAVTTLGGGRGPTCPIALFDEFAFVQGAGATVDSVELYDSVAPATAQFGGDAPIIQTTSPWDRQGQAWKSYNQATAADYHTRQPVQPDHVVFQLPSWALYQGADRAATIPMWPGGPTFPGGRDPIIANDDTLQRRRQANRESFAVEYGAQWRSSQYAYLPPQFVARIEAPYQGGTLTMKTEGTFNVTYAAHGDPSLSQANFGFAIAHLEYDSNGVPHVVFDLITHWEPANFPNGIVDYTDIENEIFGHLKAFNITTLTFDNWNSAGVIQRLRNRVDQAGLPWRPQIQQQFPSATFNWNSYEVLKTAIGHDLIHAPPYPQAHAELEALEVINGKVAAPTVGDVRTKDVADAMANVVWTLLGSGAHDLFDRLANLPLGASQPPPRSAQP